MNQSYLIRAQDSSGEQIKTYKDGTLHVQSVTVVDGSGCPVGDRATPLAVFGGLIGPWALVPNTADSEQALTVTTTPTVAGSFQANTTHVYWSASGKILVRFRTAISGRGIILNDGDSGFWRKELVSSASFFTQSGSAWIYLSPLQW